MSVSTLLALPSVLMAKMLSSSRLRPSHYCLLFVVVNLLALYAYLLWDSLDSGPSLAGAHSDVLFRKAHRFRDWLNTVRSAGLTEPYGRTEQIAMPVYGPLTYVLLKPISLILVSLPDIDGLGSFIWCFLAAIAVSSLIINLGRIRRLLDGEESSYSRLSYVAVVLVSFPFLFAFDRGNLELFTLALVAWYASRLLIKSAAPRRYPGLSAWLTSAILAVAVCIKPYTILFSLLALLPSSEGLAAKIRSLVRAVAPVLLLTIIFSAFSLAILYPYRFFDGLADYSYWQSQFKNAYVIGGKGDLFFCSPFVAGKVLLARWSPSLAWMGLYIRVYPLAALTVVASLLCACFYCNRRLGSARLRLVILMTVISFCLLVFPFNANEYKAVYLLLPFCLAPASPHRLRPADLPINPSDLGAICLSPPSLCVGLCFVLLSNRYGLIGNQLQASLVASAVLLLFPAIFLASCYWNLPRTRRT